MGAKVDVVICLPTNNLFVSACWQATSLSISISHFPLNFHLLFFRFSSPSPTPFHFLAGLVVLVGK